MNLNDLQSIATENNNKIIETINNKSYCNIWFIWNKQKCNNNEIKKLYQNQ